MIVALVIVIAVILTLIWLFIFNESERQELKEIAINGINDIFGMVDNTKKRTMVTTVIIMECLKNETQCVTQEVYTNKTELGNVSKGPMRTTNL